jgi:hypothetical protein
VKRHRAVRLGVHELMDERRGRGPHFVRRSLRHHSSVREEVEVVDDGERLVDVVGDHDRGGVERIVQIADEIAGHRERDRVEPGERLVVHDERRVERDRARERHAPLHAAGELLRHQIGRAAQSHRLELHQHQVADERFRQLRALAHREGDVVERGEIGKERAELEQHAHLAPQLVELARPGATDRPAEHPDLALRRPQRPADQPQQRRFAAAAAAHDGDDAPARDGERNAVEDRRVRKRDVFDLEQVCSKWRGEGQARVESRQQRAEY